MVSKKTAGVLGDDLAVHAEQTSEVVSSRELPELGAIYKGLLINKLIILPLAFFLSFFNPIDIVFGLFMGSLYLAWEGAEKAG